LVICQEHGKLVSRQALLQNRIARAVGAMKLKSVLGNINELIANITEAGDLFFAQCVQAVAAPYLFTKHRCYGNHN